MLHSENQRLALLADIHAHVFWGFRSYLDFVREHGEPSSPVVIADKGFIDRFKTVFSINREWGRLGRFVNNPNSRPAAISLLNAAPAERVLELGQDVNDFSYHADADGYWDWLEQWPGRDFRPHPSVERPRRPLWDDLVGSSLVVGLNTSALVSASLAGFRVEAFGDHSMAKGLGKVRSDRLSWLRSIEFDRRDPAQVESISFALGDPGRAAVCPEATAPTPASQQGTRKKRGKSKPGRPARGKRGDRSVADNGGSA